MITLAAVTWYYLAVYGTAYPAFTGPLNRTDCRALQRIRLHSGMPEGACLPVRWPQKETAR